MSSNTLDLIRSKQFWVFQLLGWSTWVLMLMLRDIIIVPPRISLLSSSRLECQCRCGNVVDGRSQNSL